MTQIPQAPDAERRIRRFFPLQNPVRRRRFTTWNAGYFRHLIPRAGSDALPQHRPDI